MQKPKVLLIAGAALGGTTIAGLIVGQHAQMFVSGKLHDLPKDNRFDAENLLCSVGTPTQTDGSSTLSPPAHRQTAD